MWQHHLDAKAVLRNYYTWDLERPEPALPSSFFWTWDHSCNWVLDDPGLQAHGCYNKYFKHPDTYVEDYRRLTDVAAGLGIKGIVIWGFLRDSHGGVEYAKRVASYAASRDVAIMPGVGTTWYGGVYYEGDHKYSLPTLLKKYPEARMLKADGTPMEFSGDYGACLAHPVYHEWLAESLDWLHTEFEIGGVNLENGDMLIDYHPWIKKLRANSDWPEDDPDEYFHQGMSYNQALKIIGDRMESTLATYATYTGFNIGESVEQNSCMGKKPPVMLDVLPEQSICQWTLTGMILKEGLPLTAYLDNGAPDAAFDNPNWPRGLRPAGKRAVGFVHQGSQWSHIGRYECTVSNIKEACLRAYRSGLEGVSIHGEVSSRHIPSAINYLVFSHFTHWPEDTMRDFGRKTMNQVLGSEKEGEDFAVILSHWDAGTLTDDLKKLAAPANHGFTNRVCASQCENALELQRYNIWSWLSAQANGETNRHNCANMLWI